MKHAMHLGYLTMYPAGRGPGRAGSYLHIFSLHYFDLLVKGQLSLTLLKYVFVAVIVFFKDSDLSDVG